MYGTIARMRIKPGMENAFLQLNQDVQASPPPGLVKAYFYRMDRNPRECYLVVLFESKEAYVANANNPEQHARYLKMLELLESPPEWNDGEVMPAPISEPMQA